MRSAGRAPRYGTDMIEPGGDSARCLPARRLVGRVAVAHPLDPPLNVRRADGAQLCPFERCRVDGLAEPAVRARRPHLPFRPLRRIVPERDAPGVRVDVLTGDRAPFSLGSASRARPAVVRGPARERVVELELDQLIQLQPSCIDCHCVLRSPAPRSSPQPLPAARRSGACGAGWWTRRTSTVHRRTFRLLARSRPPGR